MHEHWCLGLVNSNEAVSQDHEVLMIAASADLVVVVVKVMKMKKTPLRGNRRREIDSQQGVVDPHHSASFLRKTSVGKLLVPTRKPQNHKPHR
jgi:hypothetical protein